MPKFGNKSVFFGYFRARILKNYCHICNQHPSKFSIWKILQKLKMPKFGTKSSLFGYFWARNLKNDSHI